MKTKFILVKILILYTSTIFAQGNNFEDGMTWAMGTWLGVGWHYEICGDTTIQNQDYKRLFYKSHFSSPQDGYIGAISSDNDKVWIVRPDSTNQVLLYDFSLQVGETFVGEFVSLNNLTVSELTVKAIYQDTINGIERKRIDFENVSSFQGESWIEGIGSTHGFLERGDGYLFDALPSLFCCAENSNLLYGNNINTCNSDEVTFECFSVNNQDLQRTSISVFPNPTQDLIQLDFNPSLISQNKKISICNSLGNLVLSNSSEHQHNEQIDISFLENGIYYLSLKTLDGFLFTKKIIKY